MKAQNKEEKQAKQQEREKLQREIAAREKAEKQKDEYEQRMREMKAEMEAKQVSQSLQDYLLNLFDVLKYKLGKSQLPYSKHFLPVFPSGRDASGERHHPPAGGEAQRDGTGQGGAREGTGEETIGMYAVTENTFLCYTFRSRSTWRW